MKTYLAKPNEVDRKWYVVDAEGKTLGRLAVKVANVLRGRHKPTYTPHVDTGDFVIVINAAKVGLSGDKDNKKIYQRFTGYMGGQRERTARDVRAKKPEFMIEAAVRGMMPKGILARAQYRKLKVYAGAEHPHEAQQPETLDV